MRLSSLLCCTAILAACAKADTTDADSMAAAAAPSAPLALSDIAGKWNVTGTNEAGDSTLVSYVFNATSDTTGWTITFPDRPPVPVRVVSVDADSVTISAGPFESVLRKGVQVRTLGALRLRDGKLVGTTTARYSVTTADSVRVIRLEGTRAP